MIRLFLGFTAGILLALLAASVIVYTLLKYPPGHPGHAALSEELLATSRGLARQLSTTERTMWNEVLTRYNKRPHLSVSASPLSDFGLPDVEVESLQRGEPLMFLDDEEGPLVWLLVPGTDMVAGVEARVPLSDPYPAEILTAAAAALVVIGLLGFLWVIPLVRRLRSLERAIRAFGRGEWQTRADDRHPDAIGDLGRALNGMAEEIQQLLQDQQELLQAVAHELRAPLARLSFAIEIANDADLEDEREEAFQSMEESLTALGALITEVLSYARLQPGTPALEVDCLLMAPLIERVVCEQRGLNPDVDFVTDASDLAIEANISVTHFHRMLNNLLTNAARYARRRVRVAWVSNGGSFVLSVEDDGFGVPPYQRERVFEPFTRLDPSRSRHSGGMGLGLAIAQRIAQRHGGIITIEDSALGGALFKLTIPCVNAEQGMPNTTD